MAEVHWAEPALDDLRAIVEFVARDSPAYATRLARELLEAPRRLAAMPRSGAKVPEFDRDDLREVTVRPYRVVYALRGDVCLVVAVIHAGRDLSRALNPDALP